MSGKSSFRPKRWRREPPGSRTSNSATTRPARTTSLRRRSRAGSRRGNDAGHGGAAGHAGVSAASSRGAVRPSYIEALAVYLKPRVLVVLLLGFSGGLPFSLTGMALQAWMTESGVDIRTIGLFAAIGIPYLIKFLWAPLIDALDVPILSPLLGRRRGWLLLTQLVLMATILLMAFCRPELSLAVFAIAALLVSTASATQD